MAHHDRALFTSVPSTYLEESKEISLATGLNFVKRNGCCRVAVACRALWVVRVWGFGERRLCRLLLRAVARRTRAAAWLCRVAALPRCRCCRVTA